MSQKTHLFKFKKKFVLKILPLADQGFKFCTIGMNNIEFSENVKK